MIGRRLGAAKHKILASVAACGFLAACASGAPTPYGPAAGGPYGYSDTQIEANRFRVSFAGNAGTDRQTVENFALLRAAELTLAQGGQWFRIVERSVDVERGGGGPSVGVGVGGYSGGRRTSVGGSVGTSFGGGVGERYAASLQIIIGSGPPPAGADVYDANEVRLNLLGVPQ